MTDTAFLLSVLNDGRWHSNAEILQASLAERGCGLTVHSRAADLRKRGYTVETRMGANGSRRVCSYRLVNALGETAESGSDSPLGSSEHRTGFAVSPSASSPSPSLSAGQEGALALFNTPRGAYQEDQ